MNELDSIAKQARKDLTARDKAREKMLPLCRDAIRYCSNAIRAVHRREFDKAEGLYQSASKTLTKARTAVENNNELIGSGIIRDAEKELVEAKVTMAIVTGKPLPTTEELGVDIAAYLNGLGEAVGEIRRYLLDSMRRGDLSRGEELLTIMDDIYSVLITIDFPDAITGGLRRTTDMVRGVLERTRSDLTLTIRQKALENKLEALKPGELRQEHVPETVVSTSELQPVEFQGEKSPQDDEKEPVRKEELELDSIENELYVALVDWRDRKSKEESLVTYIIAKNSRLKEIAKLRPQTTSDLYEIKGLGERWINKYGKEIIAIINKGRR